MSAAEALLLFISVEFSKGWEDILISPVSGEVEDYLRAAGIVVAWESFKPRCPTDSRRTISRFKLGWLKAA